MKAILSKSGTVTMMTLRRYILLPVFVGVCIYMQVVVRELPGICFFHCSGSLGPLIADWSVVYM